VKVVVGLGNPGIKYKNNRHNAGCMVLDRFAKAKNFKFKKYLRLTAQIAGIRIKQEEVILVKPQTFMNNSGYCVRKVISKYGILENEILIIYDDIDLSLGRVRLKMKGSAGGHQGMQSIINMLDTNNVNRLKVGIGHPKNGKLSDYVLSDFTEDEKSDLTGVITDSVLACMDWITQGVNYAMRKHNQK